MAKRQTRRSVSVKGLTYQRMKDYCDVEGKSVSGYLEEIIKSKLDEAGAPVPTVLKHVTKPNVREATSQHFTF